MSGQRFDVLFLDFYGTVTTGDRLAVEKTSAEVVRAFDLPITASDLAVSWGEQFFQAIESSNGTHFRTLYEIECATLQATVRPYAGEIDATPFADMLKAYWANPPLAPHAAAFLDRLSLPVCIVSNADSDDVNRAISRHGVKVSHVVTSEDARSYKPDQGIFNMALLRMEVRPDRVLHAGDSLHSDVEGAQAAGIATCWVQYNDRILDVGNAHPDHKVSDLQELCGILLG